MPALQMVTIEEKKVTIKEFKGQRVVTFKDVDTVHGRVGGTARVAFNRRKKRFTLDKDYFVCNAYEAREEFKIAAPNGLILLTESGYLMLVKVFDDDKAWQVQRKLVNTYFRAKTVEAVEKKGFPTLMARAYRDISVMTLRDIAAIAGLSPHGVAHRVRSNTLKAEADYFTLTGDRLRAFKAENPDISTRVGCLTVVTRSGLEKLMPGKAPVAAAPDAGNEEQEKKARKERAKRYALGQWEDAPAAFRVLKRLYERYPEEKYQYPLRNAAWILAANLASTLFDTGGIMTQYQD